MEPQIGIWGRYLRLVALKVVARLGQPTQYTGLWCSDDGPHFLLIGIKMEQFRQRWSALSTQNLRLVDLDFYSEDGLIKLRATGTSTT